MAYDEKLAKELDSQIKDLVRLRTRVEEAIERANGKLEDVVKKGKSREEVFSRPTQSKSSP
jgi:hypothetical protein